MRVRTTLVWAACLFLLGPGCDSHKPVKPEGEALCEDVLSQPGEAEQNGGVLAAAGPPAEEGEADVPNGDVPPEDAEAEAEAGSASEPGEPEPSTAGETVDAEGDPTHGPVQGEGPTPSLGCSGDCGYVVVNEYLHDPNAFTQGLLYHEGSFYEGTGLYGQSSIREVDPASGEVLRSLDLSADYFGEGIALVGRRLYQLTWRSHKGFVYNVDTFEQLASFSYDTEGWGLTYDGERLIMSDGTDTLHFIDPSNCRGGGDMQVRDTRPVGRLNELEYIDGEILANVWQTDEILRIDPATGQVTGHIDLAGLLPAQYQGPNVDVLNGIAWDAEQQRLFVTGKRWPRLFEIELLERGRR